MTRQPPDLPAFGSTGGRLVPNTNVWPRDTDQLHDQLYLFSKGIGDRAPYLNIASETGTWSHWQPIHSGSFLLKLRVVACH